jgi:predicted amidohydrolase
VRLQGWSQTCGRSLRTGDSIHQCHPTLSPTKLIGQGKTCQVIEVARMKDVHLDVSLGDEIKSGLIKRRKDW